MVAASTDDYREYGTATFDEDPIVDISGEIRIAASGDGTDTPPPGALLELDVTDLGPAP